MDNVKIKVWNTKWALTQGVLEVEGYDLKHGMFQVLGDGTLSHMHYYLHGEGRDWHRTKKSAVEWAIKMAAKKIVALKKQIQNIEAKQAVWDTWAKREAYTHE
jgi:hypothetical protein